MNILITAGPTREYFDTVRYITNASSGQMGYAIAQAAQRRGHTVYLITGPVAIQPPPGVCVDRVTSAAEMFDSAVQRFPACDAAIMTAAVCDYRPADRLEKKLKKDSQDRQVLLEPTKDICATLGATKGDRVVIGFAMEDHDHRVQAEAKLRRKSCDAIVLNDMAVVASDRASVDIITADGAWTGPYGGTKPEVAEVVVDLLERLCR